MCNLIETLKAKENMCSFQSVPGERITEAENRLGLVFADDYKDYLSEFGAASYYGHELTGLCDYKRLNVVSLTIEERANNENILQDMYIIENVGVENMTIWQNSQGEIFEVPYKGTPKKICNSFIEYLTNY